VVGITGAPGVGKTSVGARLGRLLPGPSATLDLDHLAAVWPWDENDALLDLMADNLRTMLSRLVAWGARTVVVSGVVLPGRLYPRIRPLLENPGLDWRWYGLRARPETLRRRIAAFDGVQDPELRESMHDLDTLVDGLPEVVSVGTDDLTLDEVVARVVELERQVSAPRPAPPPDADMLADWSVDEKSVDEKEVRHLATTALTRRGVPLASARSLVDRLVAADLASSPSHGLLRVAEYAAAIDDGEIDPHARPKVARVGRSWLVEGAGAGGWHSAEVVAGLLADDPGPVVAVRVRRAGHLGRLGDLVRRAADGGRVVVGASTFGGTGQKVAAWGTAEGTLATNPLVVGFPADGPAVVVDISTSTWSEGAIRVAAAAGNALPDGVLLSPDGSWCPDPTRLYDENPVRRAALASLGRLEGSPKGYALAVAVELLGGALGGGSVCDSQRLAGHGGNSGLFVAADPEVFGQDVASLRLLVARFEAHVAGRPPLDPAQTVRLPGRCPVSGRELRLSAVTLLRLRELAGEA
jgi:LDH2 family malate/lactate/ureidoglycolate dehydrogenase